MSSESAPPTTEPPHVTFPPDLPVSQRKDDIEKAIRGNQVVIVAGATGSGKTTQIPKMLPGARLREHRPHPAAPHRRTHHRRAHRRGARPGGGRARRLPGALHRPCRQGHQDQADDRRHPAQRDPSRPRPEEVRRDHHRRGARTQPHRRLPARLPEAAAAAPSRPQGHHHERDDRPGKLRQALRRRRRHPSPDHRGLWPHLPGRDPLPAARASAERGGRRRPRPVPGDQRGHRRTRARERRRRAGVPLRRERDPGCRRRHPWSTSARHRGAPAATAG